MGKISLKTNVRFLATEVKPVPTEWSLIMDKRLDVPIKVGPPKVNRNSERDKALKPPDILPDEFFDAEGNRIWAKMPSNAHQCELCGFKAVTKNKYREKQDHMSKWHYSKRLEAIIPETSSFKCILCKDEQNFTSRKGLTLHMEIAHQQCGKMTSELVKKNLGLSFAEIIENAQRLSVRRTAPTQNVSNNIIKKIRFNSGDRDSVLRNKTLELREVKDSGLICVSCQSDEENNIEEDEEEENLMQSITELQNHIILKHRDIIVNESFVFIQNTAAGPQRNTFTYYLCTQCGKCFSKTSPVNKLMLHVSKECQSTNNNETRKPVERVKSDIIASVRNI